MKHNPELYRRLLFDESRKCLLCEDPVCAKACKNNYNPGKLFLSMRLANEAGAYIKAAGMISCADCESHACEKACLRGRIDSPMRISSVVSGLNIWCKDVLTDKNGMPDLKIEFCGITCENPFFLASSPVAHNYEMCDRALAAGWGGICFKTISFYPAKEVSPRFDQVECEGVPFIGFKNMEQLSEETIPVNFDMLFKLKQKYPTKVIVISIMGRSEDEWTKLAGFATASGADIIELNFSCPQMTAKGTGSDVGQDTEQVRRYTMAAARGTTRPIIAKMTPNIQSMVPVARAAYEAGAISIAAINTIKCITRVDDAALTATPVINGKGAVSGYSGKAVRPIALKFIHELASDHIVHKMGLSGIGGIESWRDALDFFLLGCRNVQVCTSVMQYGYRIIDDLVEGTQIWLKQKGYKKLSEITGLALCNIVNPDSLERGVIHNPLFDHEKCVGCGRCYISCNDGGHQAISFSISRKPELKKADCVGCGLCSLVCPAYAISFEQ